MENVTEGCPHTAEFLCLHFCHTVSQSSHSFHHWSKELLLRGKNGRTWLFMLQEEVYFLKKTFVCSMGHNNILTTWQSVQFWGGVRVLATLDSHFPGLQKAVSYLWHLMLQHRTEDAASPLKCVSCGCPTTGTRWERIRWEPLRESHRRAQEALPVATWAAVVQNT